MKIKIISIDQDKSRQFSEIMNEYIKRLSWKVTIIDIPTRPTSNIPQQQEKEGQDILRYVDNEYVIALDPRGKQLSSEEFADHFESWQQQHQNNLTFVIGGAFGLSNALKQKANMLLSLSKMTMPHRIAKLMLIEQIYRSYTIMQGHPYHK